MATVGLRDLYRAPITISADGAETYGAPVKLAKAITAELTVETAEGVLYADDAVDAIEREFIAATLKLKLNDLLQTETAVLLGQKQDADGVLYSSGEDDPPYTAIGFRAKKPGGTFKYIWLYKGKFGIPNEKYETKGSGINFNTPEMEGKFIKRPDGLWKADHVAVPEDPIAADWFKSVREVKPVQ
jgi:phi13 family phage major tail protein